MEEHKKNDSGNAEVAIREGGPPAQPAVVTSISLEISSLKYGDLHAEFNVSRGICRYRLVSDGAEERCGTLQEKEWTQLSEGIFGSASFGNWRSSYFDGSIIDGTTWTLSVRFERKHAVASHGCNGFPKEWNTMLRVFQPCCAKGGVDIMKYAR